MVLCKRASSVHILSCSLLAPTNRFHSLAFLLPSYLPFGGVEHLQVSGVTNYGCLLDNRSRYTLFQQQPGVYLATLRVHNSRSEIVNLNGSQTSCSQILGDTLGDNFLLLFQFMYLIAQLLAIHNVACETCWQINFPVARYCA